MSKALQGAAMIAGAVGFFAAAALIPGAAFLVGSVLVDSLVAGIGVGGVAMEAGVIADALTSNRGMNITTRQAASFRQIIRGEQRVGGTIVYQSTTGSKKNQYNFIIAITGHECDSIVNLYLDGRRVFWNTGSGGNVSRNGVNFGGDADGNDHIGPNGVTYNFGGKVYCEPRFGDQLSGDVITGMTANDPNWAARDGRSPSLVGCTYVYLKLEYDTTLFPGLPEIKFTVRGKNDILDPRTGTRGYTTNWALQVADHMSDPVLGLGVPVNEAQLIAAANVCDEQVDLAAGGTESRYTLHHHYDTGSDPGSVLETMLEGAAGRYSYVGGEYHIYPAYWQGPAFAFSGDDFAGGTPDWSPKRSFSELCNSVSGTYIAPNFPYSTAGDLYDSNGWADGEIQNNFPFAFQPTNFPAYRRDPAHGFASDQYLVEDGGIPLNMELNLQTVLSVGQAQRVAKINLMRNRQQGSGTFPMHLRALAMKPFDVMNFSWSEFGWGGNNSPKVLEIGTVVWKVVNEAPRNGGAAVPSLRTEFSVQETSADVYEWSVAEEQTVYSVPAAPPQISYKPAPPTNLAISSGPSTALIQGDGSYSPRILVTWDSPADGLVNLIQIQYRDVTSSTWIDAGTVDVGSDQAYITGIVAGEDYLVQIRSLRPGGAVSDWVSSTSLPTGIVYQPVGPVSGGTIPLTSTYVGDVVSLSMADYEALAVSQAAIAVTAPLAIASDTLSIPAATDSVDGYLTHSDHAAFNAKQAVLTPTAPIAISGGNISMPAATDAVDGYLTHADHLAFNAKQAALGFTPLNPANNLSDLANAATARTNLGLPTTFAPITNPSGGQNNYAPKVGPAFTGDATFEGIGFTGAMAAPARSLAANATLLASDYMVKFTAGTAYSLPAAPYVPKTGCGQILNLKNKTAGTVAINGNGKTIDGSSSFNLTAGSNLQIMYVPADTDWCIA